ncbi:MAG: hypothetical protein U9N56_02215 [Actinomycetota bacterium]|nr:hypothetical protein [Actinomycetota bacterium]
MAEDPTPEFEQPDIEYLRGKMHGPSIWSRIGSGIRAVVTHRTTWTVVLALLIIAALALGYIAFTTNP